jgi:CheY-like chemotaxis protein
MHTVLLVEDEEDLREMLREALELHGYQVVAAEDGRAALDALGRVEHVCLVLLDLFMPTMDGWEFFEKMRARPELAAVPVIVHSSAPDRAPQGVTRVLQKPLRLERLLSTVAEFCGGGATPRR